MLGTGRELDPDGNVGAREMIASSIARLRQTEFGLPLTEKAKIRTPAMGFSFIDKSSF